jgi:hypothetical protein
VIAIQAARARRSVTLSKLAIGELLIGARAADHRQTGIRPQVARGAEPMKRGHDRRELGCGSQFKEEIELVSNDPARTLAPGVVSWSSHSLRLEAL